MVVNLAEGANEIDIVVTSSDGLTQKSYTVVVIRALSVYLVPTGTIPGNGALEVALDQQINVTFNRDIWPGANLSKVTFKKGKAKVICNLEFSGQNLMVIPQETLQANATYTLYIPQYGIKDAQGNGLNEAFIFTFNTTDTIKPAINKTYPSPEMINARVDKPVKIKFSEAVKPGPDIANLKIRAGVSEVDYSYLFKGDTLELIPVVNFDYNTVYSVEIPIGAVADKAGNNPENPYTFNFTTITDRIKPSVVSTSPLNKAAEVSLNQVITVVFDENIEEGPYFSDISLKLGTGLVPATSVISGNVLQ